MRDPKKIVSRSVGSHIIEAHVLRRSQRRTLAAALLLATSPLALGDHPQDSSMRMLPPLPVHESLQQSATAQGPSTLQVGVAENVAADQTSQAVFVDPFANPRLRPIRQGTIEQTSNEVRLTHQPQSAIRLKSNGTAVGLHVIGSGQPSAIRPPAMTITSPSTADPSQGIRNVSVAQAEHNETPLLDDISVPNSVSPNPVLPDPVLPSSVLPNPVLPNPVLAGDQLMLPSPISLQAVQAGQSPLVTVGQTIQPTDHSQTAAVPVQRSILIRTEDETERTNARANVPVNPRANAHVNPRANALVNPRAQVNPGQGLPPGVGGRSIVVRAQPVKMRRPSNEVAQPIVGDEVSDSFNEAADRLGLSPMPTLELPVLEAPAAKLPALETPALETPANETPALETPANETPTIKAPSFKKSTTKSPVSAAPSLNDAAQTKPDVDPPTGSPVYFSMTDSSSANSNHGVSQSEREIESSSDSASKTVGETASKTAVESVGTKSNRPKIEPVTIPKLESVYGKSVVNLAEPIGLDSPETVPQLPDERREFKIEGDMAAMPEPVRIGNSAMGIPISTKSNSVEARVSSHKRYREPVAVDAPPMAIMNSRQSSTPAKSVSVRQPATMPQPINVPRSNQQHARSSNVTQLNLTKAQVRSLSLGGVIRRVSVGDKSVCQAITSGPSELKLIGVGNGVTRLIVWADMTGSSHTRARAFEVHVQDAVDAQSGNSANRTETLNRTIYDAFPNSSVIVREYRDRLVVTGKCDNEHDAKMIIRMVRKACLVPVRDELKVQ